VGQEQELAIRFELGRAYAQSGELEKARSAWEKVAAADPEFCEVGELLAGLTPREAAPAVELESFGDLIAEAEGGDAREPAPEHESFDDLLEAARADLDAEDGASASERERPPAGKHPEPRAKARRRKISFV
jgi:hypothetical protein